MLKKEKNQKVFSKRKIVLGGIVLCFLLSGLSLAKAATLEELQEKIKNLQAKTQNLSLQAQKYQKIIKSKHQEIQTLQNKISLLTNQINNLRVQIQKTENEILTTELEIQSLEILIEKTSSRIQKNRKKLSAVLQSIFEADQVSLLEIILGEQRFSGFLNQKQYLAQLQNSLQKLLENLKQEKSSLEEKRQEKEFKKEVLSRLHQNLSAQKQALNSQKLEKAELLKMTKGEEAQYQKLLSQIESKKAALLRQIRALEQEVTLKKNYILFLESKNIPTPGTKLFSWPEQNATLTQKYGMTPFARRGVYGGAPHNGIDMSAGPGAPVRAAQDGVILASGYNKGWGYWVAIKHLGDLVTLYAHLLQPSHLKIGTFVKKGQTIGFEGSTGFSTGSHLHFSLYYKFFTYKKNGQLYFNYFEGTLNPLDYL